MAMTRTQLRDSLLYALGQGTPASATTQEQAEVVLAVNSGLQRLWLSASHRFLRQSTTITLVAGQSVYPLSASSQEAYGPVRLADGGILRQFENRAAIDDYALEVLGGAVRTAPDGTPWGYLVEHSRAAAGDDPHSMSIRLVPAPDASAVSLLSPATIDGVVECPSYTYSDLASGALPVPEGYVETYLLPFARAELVRSPLFSRVELVQRYEADAQAAAAALGQAELSAAQTGDTGSQTPGARAMAENKKGPAAR